MKWRIPIFSFIIRPVALENFYNAESYHHDYFEKNPSNPYCMMVVAPKIAKTRAKHAHLYE